MTPEILSLISRDNLAYVAEFYKLDVDLSRAANKLEAENMLSTALEERFYSGDEEEHDRPTGSKGSDKSVQNTHEMRMELELLKMKQQLQEQQSQNLQLFAVLKDSLNTGKKSELDCLRRVDFLPKYVEGDNINSYLLQFEQSARGVFPEEIWARLLLVKLTGAARDAVQALPIEEQAIYARVKEAIELKFRKIPEYYRRGFRNLEKGSSTHVEFLSKLIQRQKSWLDSEEVNDFEDLKRLILKEAFFSKIFPDVREYLNDKTGSLQELALLADKYACMKGLGSKKSFRGNGKQYYNSAGENTESVSSDSKQHESQKNENVAAGKEKRWKQKENESGDKVSCPRCGFMHVKSNKCPDYIANLK